MRVTTNRMEIKTGERGAFITARHFDPCMAPIWQAVIDTSPAMEGDVVTFTGGREDHRGGCHPNDRALDVRTRNVEGGDEERERWAERIVKRLGPQYDVVLESDHIHIEYDPQWVMEESSE